MPPFYNVIIAKHCTNIKYNAIWPFIQFRFHENKERKIARFFVYVYERGGQEWKLVHVWRNE